MNKLLRASMHPSVLVLYAVGALLLPNVALCFTEGMSLWANIANVVLPFGAYLLLMTLSSKPGKMVWALFPLIFFAAFQLVLLYLFGQGVVAVDMFLNVVTTNTGEIFELLDNLVPAVAGVFIVYLPLLVLAALSLRSSAAPRPFFVARCRLTGMLASLLGLLLLGVACVTQPGYRISDHFYPVNVTYNLSLAVRRSVVTARYHDRVADFSFGARSERAADSTEVYVLVIGETARAANFSVYGYGRPTTPFLAADSGIIAFDRVSTQSNTTHKSVPMLLTAARAEAFDRLYTEKGVITAFREAGFHTVFFSNQLPNRSFIDFLGEEADEWRFIREQLADGMTPLDDELLKAVRQVLDCRRTKELIVLHTYGSHFNYRERYPREQAYFLPDSRTAAKFENRDDLLNAYDNSIRFTDDVLGRLTDLLRQQGGKAAWLYTSDHGENIYDDDRRLFLHASPKASAYELHVPFVCWLSEDYRRDYPEIAAALQANRHRDIQNSVSTFHTLLQLGGITTTYREDSCSVASPAFREHPRAYLNDHNEAVAPHEAI